jgi:hypothetical protein
VARAFERLLKKKPPQVDWPTFFGRTYRQAEIQAVRWSGYLADATAWVNGMDVFCDRLLDALFRADPSIGNYALGTIGSVLNTPTSRFAVKYPKTYQLVNDIHARRGESDLSHAKKRKGKVYLKSTSYIRHRYFTTARKLVSDALGEMAISWPVECAPAKVVNAR